MLRCWSCRSDAHRHDDAEVVRALDGAEDAGVELALEVEVDLLGVHDLEDLDQVAGVEAGDQRLALVLDLDLLVGDAEVGVVGGQLKAALVELRRARWRSSRGP
jgi:hypothetical protein